MANEATPHAALGARDDGAGLRILVENSEYWLRNNGDLAMLEVTIARLRSRWPRARIAVLTDSPSLLRAYFPGAEGITVFDSDPWDEPSLLERLAAKQGPSVVGPIVMAGLRARAFVPQKVAGARRKLRRGVDMLRRRPARPPIVVKRRAHLGSSRAVAQASIVLALGGGYLTDADPAQTRRVLGLIDRAVERQVPVAMVGQGIGPLADPELRTLAGAVLPRVGLIAMREGRRGPDLLRELGVGAEKTMVTGDDAIELAYDVRTDAIGTNLGICLRIADYAPVSNSAKEVVGTTVRSAATEFGAGIAPLIIAEYKSQDRRSTMPLVHGATAVVSPPGRFVHPVEIAKQVSTCRVVVTGAYHLAVFALSQGIPVVALSSSEYYDDKFLGLSEMFGDGLQLIHLDDDGLANSLEVAIRTAWTDAANLREPLRARAREQIELSRAGFDRVFELAEGGANAGRL